MNRNKGFTLIELLIVIALLGALAVGLIGAIDPFEQLKKGSDTGVRDLVNQVQTAIIRYYSVKNDMPFAADFTSTVGTPITLATVPMPAAITLMTGAGELRSDFNTIQTGSLSKVFVSGIVTPPAATVCYKPTSKSFQSDPNTKYNIDGTDATAGSCKSMAGGTLDCYWCIR